ncbi:type I glutamate--ammonia ligase [Desulfosarcina sp.]|uniref:type I glutamate--ammonia ligase n=1 Tax=Desulfosarcina sp. TaxID=2027861 RepID=UPI0029A6CF58|nr:type I glutamate--ammonia ligase [Desulfosarcina sp.]MDX2455342.1 type I glutamate--ammonia ligase [Desulfosarcina sp.]MDX2492865.1 type I glutamate--ammonia ligase [Desulfosarcina sp.]
MTPEQVLAMAKENGVKVVDIRFMDFPGMWQHFSVPIAHLDEGSFEDGFGFDGSSIRGWQPINASDMLVIPDATTAKIDPFYKDTTLVLIGNIADPITRETYTRDPRNIAKKVEAYLKSTGIGDTAFIGPEAEFFIFDDIRYKSDPHSAAFAIDSVEGEWNTARDEGPNLGYKLRHKEGYYPVPPSDRFQDLRSEMMLTLENLGIDVECQHHEVAAAGQSEIDMRFMPLLQMADQLMWFKYVLKNVAHRAGHTVTFMPKPLYGENGTGMHTHVSIWKEGKPLFAGDKYAGVSQEALWAIGGILKHCGALCAFTNPTTNSYKRLVPGYEAPVNLAYSSRNRSAAIRIPMYSASPKAKRIEFRTPDPSCNGYLAFSAIMMAVLDGIQNKIDPGDPLDKNIYDLPPEELAEIPSAPGSLDEALAALAEDHAFLLKGDVFTKDVIDTWIEYKTENEVNPVRLRPHPHEFHLYYDI